MYISYLFNTLVMLEIILMSEFSLGKKEYKERPTKYLQEAVTFFNTSIALRERFDQILKHDPYTLGIDDQVEVLKQRYSYLITKLEAYYELTKEEPKTTTTLADAETFVNKIDEEYFKLIPELQEDILAKQTQVLDTVIPKRFHLARETKAFLESTVNIEPLLRKLEEDKIVLIANKRDETIPIFDITVLTALVNYYKELDEYETNLLPYFERDELPPPEVYNPNMIKISMLEQGSIDRTIKENKKMLSQFYPIFRESLDELIEVNRQAKHLSEEMFERSEEWTKYMMAEIERINQLVRMLGVDRVIQVPKKYIKHFEGRHERDEL